MSYIHGKGEIKLSTVSDYIKDFLSVIEIEKKVSCLQKGEGTN